MDSCLLIYSLLYANSAVDKIRSQILKIRNN